MYIKYDPDEYVTEVKHTICEIHKKYPWCYHPYCMCSGSYTYRRATPEERNENKKRRLEKETREAECLREFPLYK